MDHIRDLVGVDHIGWGADFCDIFGPWYLSKPYPPFPKEFEDVSKMHNFTWVLLSRGYSDQEIKKILGGNFLRVYERILGS